MAPPTGAWKTTSGLLDDFDFTIEEAWFGTNEKFGDSVLLNLRGVAEQMVDGDMEVVDEEHTLLYSVGDGWEVQKGGRSVAHQAGKTTFVNSTNMGRLIDALVSLDGAVDVLQERGQPTDADTWEGLKLHIERKQFSYRDRNTREQVSYEVPLPVDFLGVIEGEEDEAPAKKAPAKKGAAKAPAKRTPRTKAEPEVEEEEPVEEEPKKAPAKRAPRKKSNTALRAAIVATGAEYDFEGHSDFVDFIFDPEQFDQAEALQNDEELSAEALDEDSALWAEVQAAG